MQTMAPPAEERNERAARVDERFARIDERFDETNRRITEGREETNQRFNRVEGDLRDLKSTLTHLGIGVALTFCSVILTKIL